MSIASSSAESGKTRCDLLIKADAVLPQSGHPEIHDAGVAIQDGVVVDVGPYSNIVDHYEADSSLDMTGKFLLPGLVNGHTHLPMTLFRGFADDLPLMQWLEEHIWPVEFQLTEEMLAIGARLGCAELIRTGCTAFLNGYFKEQITGHAASEAGIRAVLGEGFFSFPSPLFPTAEDCWHTIRELESEFEDNPLIRTAVTPHAAFTVSPDELVASFELAALLDIPWQIHLAESTAETAICVEKHGKRPVALLHDLGLLQPRTTLHHCVDVDTDEIGVMAETGCNVVHNPASNLKLNSGIAPVQEMLDVGVNVGLGTDGAASNNQLNMFRDMGLAALIGKVQNDHASAVSAQSALDMATRNAARCLGWPELGVIHPGHPADIIALDTAHPNLLPMHNPLSHAVYAATGHEVCMTMVAGEILYLYGEFKTIDMPSLQAEAKRALKWVVDKAKR